jgi:hypothetical protein
VEVAGDPGQDLGGWLEHSGCLHGGGLDDVGESCEYPGCVCWVGCLVRGSQEGNAVGRADDLMYVLRDTVFRDQERLAKGYTF